MSSVDEVLAGYGSLQAGQEAFYKELHRHPELSHQEHRTAQRAAGQLKEYGFTVHTGIGGTGVAGVLSNGSGPAVLRRRPPGPRRPRLRSRPGQDPGRSQPTCNLSVAR